MGFERFQTVHLTLLLFLRTSNVAQYWLFLFTDKIRRHPSFFFLEELKVEENKSSLLGSIIRIRDILSFCYLSLTKR